MADSTTAVTRFNGKATQPTPAAPAGRVMTAADLLTIAFRALPADEQEEAYARISELRIKRLEGTETPMARTIGALRRVADICGRPPTPADYKAVREELRAEGEELPPISRVIRQCGSWRRAKEALNLSETNSARRIEARFRYRRLNKIWRYTEETLRDTLQRCAAELGHVPQVSEFDWWRCRELELAAAEGNDALHLPSVTPYRKRWGTWEDALVALGCTPEEIQGRLER
jgi:hypothetical protein